MDINSADVLPAIRALKSAKVKPFSADDMKDYYVMFADKKVFRLYSDLVLSPGQRMFRDIAARVNGS